MKTKAILLIAATALVTLSFTFASIKKSTDKKQMQTTQNTSAPIGGFASEDKR